MALYQRFAEEVISSFLSEDKKGEFVSLVIDEQFMTNTAKIIGESKFNIIKDIKSKYLSQYSPTLNIDTIISIVAIQLYAASKMENDNSGENKYTAKAYYVHLNKVLSTYECYKYIESSQDCIWRTFYNWCGSRGLRINILEPKSGAGRYIQYPLNLANHTLNREDLKYISYVFQQYRLSVGEQIGYIDFWRIFDIKRSFANLSKRCTRVLESIYADTQSYDIAKSQIYNHFLEWDGEYKDPYIYHSKNASTFNDKQLSVSNKSGEYKIYIRNSATEELIDTIVIDRYFLPSLKPHYRFKHDDIIIFQQNTDYPNVWDETRYIEDFDLKGLALAINKSYLFGRATEVYRSGSICLYEFDYNEQTRKFYSEEPKSYELIGGLRVGRQTYLVNGVPILRLHRDCLYRLNGKEIRQVKGDHNLDLNEGEHILNFHRRLRRSEHKVTIVSPSITKLDWSDKFCKWQLDSKESRWTPRREINGIVGLDYSEYSIVSNTQSITQRWAKAHQGEIVDDNNNITLKLLNNQNRYE